MTDALTASLAISGSGLAAQAKRVRVISENIANAETTGSSPLEQPFRRKTVTFSSVADLRTGLSTVEISRIGLDPSQFTSRYEPNHPAAGPDGHVLYPNVDMLVEIADMREAVRGYEANLQAYKQARDLAAMTIDLLRK